MFLVSRAVRLVIAGCLVVALGACTSDDADPQPDETGPPISVDKMRAALLPPEIVGRTWSASDDPPSVTAVAALCAGGVARVPAPGSPTMAVAAAVDEGDKGAQTFDQAALVYSDAASAKSAVAALRSAAGACPTTVNKPAATGADNAEAAYTETVTVSPLATEAWSGFSAIRHKQYEPKTPGSADAAVLVLRRRNVVLVAGYAIYWVGVHTTGPEFTADWRRLVGTVLDRVEA